MPEVTRILLIEDNDADVLLIQKALESTHRSFETSRFQNGAEALPVLLDSQPADLPDAILLDLNTPCCDGMDILRQIRSSPRLTGIPVGILTGSAAPGDRQRALTNGASHYIHKAASYDAFLSNVREAVLAMVNRNNRSVESRLPS